MLKCVAGVALAAAPAAAAGVCTPRVETLSLTLGGAPSRAEILRPAVGAPLAVMVLIHGSDVADLDNSIVAADGTIVSTPLRDVARAMACAGIATIRYDKRFVSGPAKVDRAAFGKVDLKGFLADAVVALDTARRRPDLAGVPEMAFGWSEGTTVAATLAAQRPTLQGVVLMAPVISGFAATLGRQFPRVGASYMQRYATAGAVDAGAIARAAAGPAGVITQIYVRMFKGFAPGETINPLLDKNGDGRIAIAAEATPVIAGWFADGPNGGLGIYASSVALPGVGAQLASIRVPVLMLQGEADGALAADDARALAATRQAGITVRIYPGLGHALGPSPSPLEDQLLPTAAAPLRDMAAWAARVAGQAVTPPAPPLSR